jgi:7-cyano-7-deazaguanine synthase
MSTILVLHSGGLDSTVCLLLARERRANVVSLGIDYGQKHRVELKYAARQCRRFKVKRRVVRVSWTKPDRTIPTGRTIEEMRQSISPAFLPGRNAVFLSLASAEAAGLQANQIWIGVNCIDYSGYPDCTPEFVESFRQMLNRAIPDGPGIVAPLLLMKKSHIAREALRLGLGRHDTWSCYRPVQRMFSVKPCGQCDACILHEAAWRSLDSNATHINSSA